MTAWIGSCRQHVFLGSWAFDPKAIPYDLQRNDMLPFYPMIYPYRLFSINLVVQKSNLSPRHLFAYASAFGPLLRAHWTPAGAVVTFFTQEDTFRAFRGFAAKNYSVGVVMVSNTPSTSRLVSHNVQDNGTLYPPALATSVYETAPLH